ncbi:MAG: hypothetical protein ACI9ES_000923, partial [Oceanospirillaceae bacterium]
TTGIFEIFSFDVPLRFKWYIKKCKWYKKWYINVGMTWDTME